MKGLSAVGRLSDLELDLIADRIVSRLGGGAISTLTKNEKTK